MKAYMRVQMNMPVDPDKDYISPGGFHVKIGKEEYGFDFTSSQSGADCDNPSIYEAWMRDEDYESFPELEELRKKITKIDSLEDMFVYAESDKNPGLAPVKLLAFQISDTINMDDKAFGKNFVKSLKSTPFVNVKVEDISSGRSKCVAVDYEFTKKLLDTHHYENEKTAVNSQDMSKTVLDALPYEIKQGWENGITVSDILWDTEDNGAKISSEEASLPDTVTITPEDIKKHEIDEEGIADYLSDKFGYCVKSFAAPEPVEDAKEMPDEMELD